MPVGINKIKSQEFKVWLDIERHTVFEDGSEEYTNEQDMDSCESVGKYITLEEAQKALAKLAHTIKFPHGNLL